MNKQSGIPVLDYINQKLIEKCKHEVWVETDKNRNAICSECGIDE